MKEKFELRMTFSEKFLIFVIPKTEIIDVFVLQMGKKNLTIIHYSNVAVYSVEY